MADPNEKNWPALLEAYEAEIDAAIAEDDAARDRLDALIRDLRGENA